MSDLAEIFRKVTEVTNQAAKIYALTVEIDALPEDKTPDSQDQELAFLSAQLETAADALSTAREMVLYLSRPIIETSRLWKNGSGQYETTKGYCFRDGSPIEVLVPGQYYTDRSYWERTRLRYDGKNYYLAGHTELSLEGLAVRVRKGDRP